MAWARVQSVGAAVGIPNGVVVQSVTLGSAPTTGNALVAVVAIDSSSTLPTIFSIQDGNGVNFTLVEDVEMTVGADTPSYMAVYTLVVPATPSTTVTANYTNTSLGAGAALMVTEFSGITTTVDGTPGTSAQATGTVTQPAYTSTASSELLLSCYGDDGDPGLAGAGGSWAADPNNVSSGHAQVGIQYKNSTNGAETGGLWTTGTGGNAGIVAFALTLPATPHAPFPSDVVRSQAVKRASYF